MNFLRTEPDGHLRRRDHLTFKGNRSQGRHGWLRLTPAYSLHLVQGLVAGLSPEDVVLDPFCGTGTTALACSGQGIACDTVDLNPFLVWLASAKCASYDEAEIRHANMVAQQAVSQGVNGKHAWVPPIQDIHKWWSDSTLHALSGLFARISEEPASRARDLLRIAFCRTVIETAAVSFRHQSMSFRRADTQPTLFDEPASQIVAGHFERALAGVLDTAAETPTGIVGVYLGDSRNLDRLLPPERYSAVITSPPYPNRMSYIRELRPYMYWLGYLTDGRQAGELDWKAIGGTWGCATSLVAKWEPSTRITVSWGPFDACIKGIKGHSDLLGRYVHKYFEDAVLHVESLVRVLARGARVHYVVGNSKFYDVLLPTEEIYAAIFRAAGLGNVAVERFRKRTSKKELFEFVVHGTKP
ncbi:site-specific DNA-methyltransferase [Candidatus Binatia bacterium]|nr:site-specific DNA-methyltransferase [Candidatus Binatia bacterium]